MTKAKGTQGGKPRKAEIQVRPGETESATMARVMVNPYLRHGIVAQGLSNRMAGKLPGEPHFDDFGKAIKSQAEASLKGDLSLASELLTAQALSLDAMFTELARRATMNFGDYPQAAERYARLAFKAQANSRASLEALAKLHQPREQTVRHVHVSEGGQAVVADQLHYHGGTDENENSVNQSHATPANGVCTALPGPDPVGDGVPIASGERAEAVSHARRD